MNSVCSLKPVRQPEQTNSEARFASGDDISIFEGDNGGSGTAQVPKPLPDPSSQDVKSPWSVDRVYLNAPRASRRDNRPSTSCIRDSKHIRRQPFWNWNGLGQTRRTQPFSQGRGRKMFLTHRPMRLVASIMAAAATTTCYPPRYTRAMTTIVE